MLDVAIPAVSNIRKKEYMKTEGYQEHKEQLEHTVRSINIWTKTTFFLILIL